MYLVTVTEPPRVGQRKPRVYQFLIDATTEEEARKNWASDKLALLYGNEPGSTTAFERTNGGYRISF